MGSGKGQTKRVSQNINLSKEEQALDKLREIFHELDGEYYQVGGSVRDELLGLASKDLDFVAVNINQDKLLEQLRKYGRAEVIGESFGVTNFRPKNMKDFDVEIALPRLEQSNGNGHNDFEITKIGEDVSLEDDLLRRDFTINAIAKNIQTGEVISPKNAINDLENKVLRLVNDNAFKEDPLRILRGVQFVSRFNLNVEQQTLDAMKKEVHGLASITWERKLLEMDKLMKGSERGKAIDLMTDIGAWDYVIPEIKETIGVTQNNYHAYDVYTHLREALSEVPSDDIDVRWAALLHDIGKPGAKWIDDKGIAHFYKNPKDPNAKAHETLGAEMTTEILTQLRMPNDRIKKITLLVDNHMKPLNTPSPKLARQLISAVGKENINALLDLHEGDKRGSGKITEQKLADIKSLRNMVNHEIKIGSPTSLQDLEINGNDLITELNFPKDKSIGYALSRLLKQVLKDPSVNDKKTLLNRAKSFHPDVRNK